MAVGHIDRAGAGRMMLYLLVALSVTAPGQTLRRPPPNRTSSTSVSPPASSSDEPERCRVRRVTAFPSSHQFATDFIDTIATDPGPHADDPAAIWGLTADL